GSTSWKSAGSPISATTRRPHERGREGIPPHPPARGRPGGRVSRCGRVRRAFAGGSGSRRLRGRRAGGRRDRAEQAAEARGAGRRVTASIRPANPADLRLIASLIRELAEYEKLSHEVRFDEAVLGEQLFGPRPYAEVLIAEADGEPQGFA